MKNIFKSIRIPKIKRKVIISIILIAAIGGTSFYFGKNYFTKKDIEEFDIKEEKIQQGSIKIDIVSDGKVSIPMKNVDFEVTGKISNILVKPGQEVKKDDILAEIGKTDYEEALQKAESTYQKTLINSDDSVDSAKLQLNTDKQKLDELKQKIDSSQDDKKVQIAAGEQKLKELETNYLKLKSDYDALVAKEAESVEIDAKRTQYESAKASYINETNKFEVTKKQLDVSIQNSRQNYDLQEQKYGNTLENQGNPQALANINISDSKIALDKAKSNLDKTILRAPSEGTIVYISKKIGDSVNTQTADKTATTTSDTNNFILLATQDKPKVTTSVSESDIKNISLGQKVRVGIESTGDEDLTGQVTEMNTLPKTDSNGVTTYSVTAELDNSGEKVLEGMSCVISFIVKEKRNVLTITNKAVKSNEGKQYVEIRDKSGKITKQDVQTGLSDGEISEVIAGLKRGDTVIIKTPKKKATTSTSQTQSQQRGNSFGGVGGGGVGPGGMGGGR